LTCLSVNYSNIRASHAAPRQARAPVAPTPVSNGVSVHAGVTRLHCWQSFFPGRMGQHAPRGPSLERRNTATARIHSAARWRLSYEMLYVSFESAAPLTKIHANKTLALFAVYSVVAQGPLQCRLHRDKGATVSIHQLVLTDGERSSQIRQSLKPGVASRKGSVSAAVLLYPAVS
jgi:hypothetical protein